MHTDTSGIIVADNSTATVSIPAFGLFYASRHPPVQKDKLKALLRVLQQMLKGEHGAVPLVMPWPVFSVEMARTGHPVKIF